MRLKVRHLAFLLLLITAVKAQPVAQFSASPSSGCSPLLVNFFNSSTGNPTSFRWDFGDGSSSTRTNPSKTYTNPGSYTVKLIVQGASGRDSIIKSNYIVVYPQPTVEFSVSERSGCAPLTVSFFDSSATAMGNISSWIWDFGDGNFSTSQNPTHTYTVSGTFNVSLKVTTNQGCVKSRTRLRHIRIFEGPNAQFSYQSSNRCTSPVSIQFNNQSTGTAPLQYLWSFGDGSTSTLTNPSHTYTRNASFDVRLIVTNANGCSDTLLNNNAISLGNVLADFSMPARVCARNTVLFNNTSNPTPASSLWIFGNNDTLMSQQGLHTFVSPGNYSVTLISNFGTCRDTVTKSLAVLGGPIAAFHSGDTISCRTPFNVLFSNHSSNATSFLWNFGDNTTSALTNPSHIFHLDGNYSISLVASAANGCTDTLTKNQYVKINKPQVSINNLPQTGCAPFQWTFSSSLISSDSASQYIWDFGDGSTSSLANPTHVFDSGSYKIKLITTTASGCSDTAIIVNGIIVGKKPRINFSATPLITCANMPVYFSDLTTDSVNRWTWYFGDGGTSGLRNPNYIYTDTGYFSVRLIANNNGCSDTLEKEDYIYIKPPIAKFTFTKNCINKYRRVFRGDRSIGADAYFWDFGDGNTSITPNPVHNYNTTGVFQVKLRVVNNSTGCESVNTQEVIIADEKADFTSPDSAICRSTQASFTAINSNPFFVSSYTWNFGDNTGGSGISVTHAYANPGIFSIRLIVTDVLGCRDTLIKPNQIRINGATANFSPTVAGSCLFSNVGFNDLSTLNGTYPINSWSWDFGDGSTQTYTSGPFAHTYQNPGVYSVSLTVTDAFGCTNTKTLNNILQISKPIASFQSNDTLSCPAKTIQFNNNSTGPGLRYFWNFGDGTVDTTMAPSHVYSTDGYYSVSLVVTDQFGCMDSIRRINYIRIVTGRAFFSMSDSVGSCPPLIVNFSNLSSQAASYNWDFGDSTNSTLPSPSHFYSEAGIYTTRLTVLGIGGCYSTYERIITVKGPSGVLRYTPISGCSPVRVEFTASVKNTMSIVWDFNDGNTVITSDSTFSYIYDRPGIYIPGIILRSSDGCQVPIFGRDTLHVQGVRVKFNIQDSVFCNTGNVFFENLSTSDDIIGSYYWDFGDGSHSSSTSPNHTYNTPGMYYPSLIASTSFGCQDTLMRSIPIIISSTPRPLVTHSGNGCTPLSASFFGSVSNPDSTTLTWNWNLDNGRTSNLQNPANEIFQNAGIYDITLTVTNQYGCSDQKAVAIESYPIPVVKSENDTVRCYGRNLTLHATGANTYLWSSSGFMSCTQCADPYVTPDQPTVYHLTGTSVQGCKGYDSVKIIVAYPIHIAVSNGDTLCNGESVLMYASGADTYTWSPAVESLSANNTLVSARPQNTTVYRVTGKDRYNCFSETKEIPIKVYPIPTVEAGADITLSAGSNVDLVPIVSADVTQVIWSPTGNIFRNNYPSISVKPRETTVYTVEVSNPGKCSARDQVTVYVTCDGTNVFIPNTFTPNNDGMNDVFFPRGKGLFSIKSMKIFNRWGEIMFENSGFAANNPGKGWDGTYKGRSLSSDVFVYVLEVVCENNSTLIFKGNVALMK